MLRSTEFNQVQFISSLMDVTESLLSLEAILSPEPTGEFQNLVLRSEDELEYIIEILTLLKQWYPHQAFPKNQRGWSLLLSQEQRQELRDLVDKECTRRDRQKTVSSSHTEPVDHRSLFPQSPSLSLPQVNIPLKAGYECELSPLLFQNPDPNIHGITQICNQMLSHSQFKVHAIYDQLVLLQILDQTNNLLMVKIPAQYVNMKVYDQEELSQSREVKCAFQDSMHLPWLLLIEDTKLIDDYLSSIALISYFPEIYQRTQLVYCSTNCQKHSWSAVDCQGVQEEPEGRPGGPGRDKRARGDL